MKDALLGLKVRYDKLSNPPRGESIMKAQIMPVHGITYAKSGCAEMPHYSGISVSRQKVSTTFGVDAQDSSLFLFINFCNDI